MKTFLAKIQTKKISKFFCLNSRFSAVFFALLLASSSIKPIDPITLAVVGGAGAMTVRAFSKTAVGKIVIAYAFARAAQTPAGRYMLAQIQRRAGNTLSEQYIAMRKLLNTNILEARDRMKNSIVARSYPSQASVQISEIMKDGCKKTSSFREQLLSSFENKSSSISEKIEDMQKNNKRANCWQYNHADQVKTYQNVYVAPGATFVSSHPQVSDAAGSRQQFWKGVCVGSFVGATTMAWLDNKREERVFAYLFSENEK